MKKIFFKKSLKTQTNDKMFFEDHAWVCGFRAKNGKNQEQRFFFKKDNIEKRINDFLFFLKTKRFFEEAQKEDW